MGNLISSGSPSPPSAPNPPPPLLSAAVIGDAAKFHACIDDMESKDVDSKVSPAEALKVVDAQSNNVLHALFSCNNPDRQDAVCEILKYVHATVSPDTLANLYRGVNSIGCNPIWIVTAYGNIGPLKIALAADAALVTSLLQLPNLQGDSCVLATCSKGNTAMLTYLSTIWPDPTSFHALLSAANNNGTTPLQIVTGNGHLETLSFFVKNLPLTDEGYLKHNKQGLSLFHICAERNFHAGLEVLLEVGVAMSSIKDKNDANPIHVACFCGNKECVEVFAANCGQEELEAPDGTGRTGYWLAMLKGYAEVGEVLKKAGVDTENEKMLGEIAESDARRAESKRKKEEEKAKGQVSIN